jgi:hypothetical protein
MYILDGPLEEAARQKNWARIASLMNIDPFGGRLFRWISQAVAFGKRPSDCRYGLDSLNLLQPEKGR